MCGLGLYYGTHHRCAGAIIKTLWRGQGMRYATSAASTWLVTTFVLALSVAALHSQSGCGSAHAFDSTRHSRNDSRSPPGGSWDKHVLVMPLEPLEAGSIEARGGDYRQRATVKRIILPPVGILFFDTLADLHAKIRIDGEIAPIEEDMEISTQE